MNLYRKYANDGHETAGRLTTRAVSKHGLKAGARYYKRYYNRLGKRAERKLAFRDES